MMTLKTGSAIIILLSSLAHAEEAPKLTVVATPAIVSENESVQLKLEVVASGPVRAFPPEFTSPDFTIAGAGTSGGQTSVMENGKITVQTRMIYSYVLMPKKVGILSISNISMRVGSDTLKSNDIKIKVEPDNGSSSSRQANPQNEDEDTSNPAAPNNFSGGRGVSPPINTGTSTKEHPGSVNSDFTVFAAFNKKTAYVGEPVIVEFYIYDFGNLRQVEVQKWPTFNGFWKDDLQLATRFEFEDVYVGNRPMRRTFVGRYALYGIKPGKLSVDKLVIRGQYVSRNAMPRDDDDPMSFFMGNLATLSTGIHASQEVVIDVLPLPEQGRPEKFGGAVGHFDLELAADKTNVPANTPITLTATLKGRGNFQSIDGIKIPLPQDFELYETTTQGQGANPIGARRGLDSQKAFQTIVIPRKAGTYQIPSLSWSYFDVDKKAYQTITTKPLDLVVTESVAGAGPTNNYLTDTGKTEAPKIEELRYLKTPHSSLSLKKYVSWLVFLLLAANLVLLARLFGKKKNILQSAIQKLDPLQSAKSSLKGVAGSKNWLNDLEETVNEILEALLKTNPRGVTRGELHDLWRNSGLPYELFQKIESLLSTLDQQRFAGASTNHEAIKARLIQQAEEILKAAGKIK